MIDGWWWWWWWWWWWRWWWWWWWWWWLYQMMKGTLLRISWYDPKRFLDAVTLAANTRWPPKVRAPDMEMGGEEIQFLNGSLGWFFASWCHLTSSLFFGFNPDLQGFRFSMTWLGFSTMLGTSKGYNCSMLKNPRELYQRPKVYIDSLKSKNKHISFKF